MPKDLVQIIRENPGCCAIIDNDCWILCKQPPRDMPENLTGEEEDGWEKDNLLASSDDDLVSLGDGGYGSGCCYGGDILQALAAIVGIQVISD